MLYLAITMTIKDKREKLIEAANSQSNSERKKQRKTEESSNGVEGTSTNQNKNKDRNDISDTNEGIKEKKEKEIAGNDGQVDKEISKNSRQVIDGGAPLQTVFWNGKTIVDKITAYLFYMKVNLTACTIAFDGNENFFTKYHAHARMEIKQLSADVIVKKGIVHHTKFL